MPRISTKDTNNISNDLVRRLLAAEEILVSEVLQRNALTPAETKELKSQIGGWYWERLKSLPRPMPMVFAAELANADRQLAARIVTRGVLTLPELSTLKALLKFQPREGRTGKLNELINAIELAIEKECMGNGGR